MADRGVPPGSAARATRAQAVALLGLAVGALAVLGAMVLGVAGSSVDLLVSGAPAIRALLAGLAIVLGGWWLVRAVRGIDTALAHDAGAQPDLRRMVRSVRGIFLAAAAFAAAAGWIVGHPLPILIALVIAGVDLLETSFLLLVASGRSR